MSTEPAPPTESDAPRPLPLPVRMLLRLLATIAAGATVIALLVGTAYALFGGPFVLMSLWWAIRD